MYSIKKERFGKFTRILLCRGNDYAAIIPERGGTVHELVLGKKIIEGESARQIPVSPWFKGAKLLPFPNRVLKGKYRFNNNTYQLPINFPKEGNAIHGLLYNKHMEIVSAKATRSSATIRLAYCMAGLEGYPFNLSITMMYRIDKDGFSCSTVVKNVGKDDAPFGDGWHPYFTLGRADNLTISTLGLIGKKKFDDCFPWDGTVKLTDGKAEIELLAKGYGYLQVFTAPDRKTVALEPMTCPPNAFNTKKDLILLLPGKTWRGVYGIRVRK